MPIVSTARMNAQQFLMLGEDPPGVRLELVNGEVAVSPSPVPKHSYAVLKLARLLDEYVEDHDLGQVFQDVDTILDQYNVRRPDILYFAKDRLNFVGDKAMEGPPDLAVEVLSPSSVEIDRGSKFSQYAKAGVAHYWIVDPEQRTLEGWKLGGRRYKSQGRAEENATVCLAPFPKLEIPLKRLWWK